MRRRHRVISYSAVISLLLLMAVVAAFMAWFYLNQQPVAAEANSQIFVVKRGQSLDAVAAALEAQGLIRSRAVFKLLVAQKGLSKQIQAGTYRLSPSLSQVNLLTALTHGTLDVWVTLLEGWRREEIAAELAQVMATAGAPFDETVFLQLTQDKEGYLFPDTYLIPVGATEANIVALLENTFKQKVTQGLSTSILASGRSLADITTMASLAEREARSETARKMVAGILWKRLDAGWPLQVDATLQYAKGYDAADQTWWTPPTYLDKQVESPYNTYTHPGLPPGPIASPSLSAIQAALNPTPSDYWFYLTGNDNQMHYAVTAADHAQNIRKYL